MSAQIKEGMERNSVVYACVNVIARSSASIPWVLSRKTSQGLEEIEGGHPLLTLLERPNPWSGQGYFMYCLMAYWLITGNAFIWTIRIGKEPKELWTLRPDRFAIQPGGTMGLVKEYIYRVNGRDQTLLAEDVLHLRMFQDWAVEWFGLSPVKVGALLVDTDNNAVNWNRSLLKNRGRPDAIFAFKQTLIEDQRASFERRLKEAYGGGENAGRPLIAEGADFTYQQLSQSPSELDFVASTSMTNRRICQLYNVPPELIGDPQNKTYSNQAEARLALIEQVVFPHLDSIRDELNNWLVPMFDTGLYLDYDKDSVDVIAEKRKAVFDRVLGADWLTLNEKREATGYDRYDDESADVPQAILNQQSLDNLSGASGGVTPEDVADEEYLDEEPAVKRFESKFLNLDTEEKKMSFWNSIDKQRVAMEKTMARLFEKHFIAERKAVGNAYRKDGKGAALAAVRARKPALRQAYKMLYATVGRYFFNQARDGILSGVATKGLQNSLKQMRVYFEGQVGEKVDAVTTTTTERLAKLIGESILAGKDTDAVIADIDTLYEEHFAAKRVTLIAETEVGVATNMGLTFGAKSTDLALKKQWISQRDERVRDPSIGSEFTHRSPTDGQIVELDELFDVSGEKMEFPSDTSHGASMGNIAGCRCNVSFVEA